MSKASKDFLPLNLAVLTVSDSRGEAEDTSGHYLKEAAVVSAWIADESIQAILINGGTGFTLHDNTPEALKPLFDREIEGYGELFRMVSFEEIGTSTIQSRALAGMANETVIFAMPGSTRACRTAWEHIIEAQLDARNGPCNFTPHVKK